MFGIGGAFALVFQALLAALFTLSPVERVLLSVCAFLVALGVIVAVAKVIRGRGSRTKTSVQANSESAAPQPPPANADSGHAQQAEIEAYRAEVASLEAQRNRLQSKVDAYDGDRDKLKALLNDAHTEGTSLRERNPDWRVADDWATAVSRLVRAAFGDQAVKVLMDDSGDRLAADREATREQAWMDNRLHRLHRLRQTLGDRDTVPFRSGFDPHEWREWKSPPPTGSEELEDLRAKLREVEQERDELEAENKRLGSQPGDEDLKDRALRLSAELFRFVEQRDEDDPKGKLNAALSSGENVWETSQVKGDYDNETAARYHQYYEPDVRALLNALERRGWCDAEERKEIENTFASGFMSTPTERIRRGAARMAAFGNRI